MVGDPGLKSGTAEFKSRSDHLVDLFQVFPGSTPQLLLYLSNWSASCQLVLLTCSVHLLYSVTICIVGAHQSITAT